MKTETLHSCGHRVPRSTRYAPSESWKPCPTCANLTGLLTLAGIPGGMTDDLKAVADEAYKTPTGRPKRWESVMGILASKCPEMLPRLVAGLDSGNPTRRLLEGLLSGEKEVRPVSNHVACALAIKKELNARWPKCVLHARSDYNSVNIRVSPNLTDEEYGEAQRMGRRYQSGHFNGMEDIYEYTNRDDSIPQVMYVTIRRH